MRRIALVLGLLVLAACSRSSQTRMYNDEVTDLRLTKPPALSSLSESGPAATPSAEAKPTDAAAAPAEGDSSTAPRIASGPPMLAYSYSYSLAVPHGQVDELRKRHEAACAKAGYKLCQVVSASITNGMDGGAMGKLEIRAASVWLQSFRAGLPGEAKAAGGKVQSSEVSSEDLSREIVDTSAQLRAKTVLRDRLQSLLANRPGKIGDLLEVERELARVQGEIDSTQSQLAVMQGRVAMSDVTLNYESSDLGPTIRSPLSGSFRGFFGTMASSLAALIDVVAVLAPWALIVGGLGWVFRKRLPNLRWPFRKRPAPPAP